MRLEEDVDTLPWRVCRDVRSVRSMVAQSGCAATRSMRAAAAAMVEPAGSFDAPRCSWHVQRVARGGSSVGARIAFGGASLEAASPRTPGEVPEARGVVELLTGCDEGHGVPSEARSEARDDLRTRARAR